MTAAEAMNRAGLLAVSLAHTVRLLRGDALLSLP
jgi:hypothetical protein